MSDTKYNFIVRTPEGRSETVVANAVEVNDKNILVFYDGEGVKARFLRWEHYVRGEPA